MKVKYQTWQLEILFFNDEDVITASLGQNEKEQGVNGSYWWGA